MPLNKDEEAVFYEEFCKSHESQMFILAKGNAPSIDFQTCDVRGECRIWEGYFDACLVLLEEIVHETPGEII